MDAYRKFLTPRNVLWLGAVIVIIGSVLPWATIDLGELGDMAEEEGIEIDTSVGGLEGDGILTLILAVIIGVVAFFFKPTSEKYIGWIASGLGVVTLIIAIIDIIDVNRSAGPEAELFGLSASVGFGLFVVAIGAIICIVGGFVPWPEEPTAEM